MTATRRRGAELENAVLDAAWELLLKNGYSAMTYDAVAQRAQTAKQVIYRRWPTKRDLLFALLRHRGSQLPTVFPDTGSLRNDLLVLMRNSNGRIPDIAALLSGLVGTHFDEVEATPSELRNAILGGRSSAVQAAVDRAVARGEIGPGAIPDRVLALPYDLYRHDAIMTLSPLPDESLVEIVDVVWMPLVKIYAAAS